MWGERRRCREKFHSYCEWLDAVAIILHPIQLFFIFSAVVVYFAALATKTFPLGRHSKCDGVNDLLNVGGGRDGGGVGWGHRRVPVVIVQRSLILLFQLSVWFGLIRLARF